MFTFKEKTAQENVVHFLLNSLGLEFSGLELSNFNENQIKSYNFDPFFKTKRQAIDPVNLNI